MKLSEFETEKQFFYENGFYLTSDISRIGKLLTHYELYKKIKDIPGIVIELGVFKGVSFIRWLTFRNLLENENSRKIVGFDSFGVFPETNFSLDKKYKDNFVKTAGKAISKEELDRILKFKNLRNYELIEGNILHTLPKYVEENPHIKISLLHIDTDVYEPAKLGLELLWPKLTKGGIVIFDDYGSFPGETKAVDEFFSNIEGDVQIKKLTISHNIPSYVIKDRY